MKSDFFFNEISLFGVDFEICNFVDVFMPKHTHYTLTKIQKVKKHLFYSKFNKNIQLNSVISKWPNIGLWIGLSLMVSDTIPEP